MGGLNEVRADLEAAVPRAALAAARGAAAEAKADAPVDTGALQESIRAEQDGKDAAVVIAGGGGVINPKHRAEVDYAVFVEADHPTHAGFLRRALANQQARLREMGEVFSAAMARAARRRLGYATARARGASPSAARRLRDTTQPRVRQP